jgi:hypothetical protein
MLTIAQVGRGGLRDSIKKEMDALSADYKM